MAPEPYHFDFSLTVLDHLGRQLYRNFITILGEAISNAWDADANNVWITIDRDNQEMLIRDDGNGMTSQDLQDKFLRIGYSKRKSGETRTASGRVFIGAKGIGKLALLSCAEKISVVTKTKIMPQATGCVIDNAELDRAIDDDQVAQSVNLDPPSNNHLETLERQESGTTLTFTSFRAKNSTDSFLRTAIAMYYRFSLVDPNFRIFFQGEQITTADMQALAEDTQYLWHVGVTGHDEYIRDLAERISPRRQQSIQPINGAWGFLATVTKPSNLEIFGARERAGIDLFVNGRLRERNILAHRPKSQVPAQYLYGQIHFDTLDTGSSPDVFTSSREGVVEGSEQFEELLDWLNREILAVIDQWDEWRLLDKHDGDSGNTKRRTVAERAADTIQKEQVKHLFGEVTDRHFAQLLAAAGQGLNESLNDYAQLYTLENLLRSIGASYDFSSNKLRADAQNFRSDASRKLEETELVEECRTDTTDWGYVGIGDLLRFVANGVASTHGVKPPIATRKNDVTYLRNVVMHTTSLTDYGQEQLHALVNSISGELKRLVSNLERTAKSDGDA